MHKMQLEKLQCFIITIWIIIILQFSDIPHLNERKVLLTSAAIIAQTEKTRNVTDIHLHPVTAFESHYKLSWTGHSVQALEFVFRILQKVFISAALYPNYLIMYNGAVFFLFITFGLELQTVRN